MAGMPGMVWAVWCGDNLVFVAKRAVRMAVRQRRLSAHLQAGVGMGMPAGGMPGMGMAGMGTGQMGAMTMPVFMPMPGMMPMQGMPGMQASAPAPAPGQKQPEPW
jgi:hypothetical protein